MDNIIVLFNCNDKRSDETSDILNEDYHFLVCDGDDYLDIQFLIQTLVGLATISLMRPQ